MDKISFKKLNVTDDIAIPVLKAAKSDRYIGDVLQERNTKAIMGFFYEEALAGFAVPRKEGDGYRTGPIFVLPSFRNKGIAKAFVNQLFASNKGNAYIEETNIASQRLFLSCGFVKQEKFIKDKDDVLYLYKKS